MDKLLWTPSFPGVGDFSVYLDRNYAIEMVEAKIPGERQRMLNTVGKDDLNRMGINWSEPYYFHDDTCLVSQFNLGSNGVWLATNHHTIDELIKIKDLTKPIEFSSHNVTRREQAYSLMFLVDRWIQYAEILKNG